MAGHGDVEADTLADRARIDLPQLVCCSLCLGPAAMQAILKLVQRLPHRVGKRHLQTCLVVRLIHQTTWVSMIHRCWWQSMSAGQEHAGTAGCVVQAVNGSASGMTPRFIAEQGEWDLGWGWGWDGGEGGEVQAS